MDGLSEAEINQVKVFTTDVIHQSDEEIPGMNLAQKAVRLKRQKVLTMHDHTYINLEFIPPTSNIFERLFSSASLVLIANPWAHIRHVSQILCKFVGYKYGIGKRRKIKAQ